MPSSSQLRDTIVFIVGGHSVTRPEDAHSERVLRRIISAHFSPPLHTSRVRGVRWPPDVRPPLPNVVLVGKHADVFVRR